MGDNTMWKFAQVHPRALSPRSFLLPYQARRNFPSPSTESRPPSSPPAPPKLSPVRQVIILLADSFTGLGLCCCCLQLCLVAVMGGSRR